MVGWVMNSGPQRSPTEEEICRSFSPALGKWRKGAWSPGMQGIRPGQKRKRSCPRDTEETALQTPWLELRETGCRLPASRRAGNMFVLLKLLHLWRFVTITIGETSTRGKKRCLTYSYSFEYFGLLRGGLEKPWLKSLFMSKVISTHQRRL